METGVTIVLILCSSILSFILGLNVAQKYILLANHIVQEFKSGLVQADKRTLELISQIEGKKYIGIEQDN